jgi:hypothetical protein
MPKPTTLFDGLDNQREFIRVTRAGPPVERPNDRAREKLTQWTLYDAT